MKKKKGCKHFIRNTGSATATFLPSAFTEPNRASKKDVLKQSQAPK